jgi:hypothetical protein
MRLKREVEENRLKGKRNYPQTGCGLLEKKKQQSFIP